MSLTPKPESKQSFAPATRLVHAGRDPGEQHGFVNTPISSPSTSAPRLSSVRRRCRNAAADHLDLDDHGMVQEAVEQRGGDYGMGEDLALFGEAAV